MRTSNNRVYIWKHQSVEPEVIQVARTVLLIKRPSVLLDVIGTAGAQGRKDSTTEGKCNQAVFFLRATSVFDLD